MELLDGESKNYDYSFKILLLGKSAIGKSFFYFDWFQKIILNLKKK